MQMQRTVCNCSMQVSPSLFCGPACFGRFWTHLNPETFQILYSTEMEARKIWKQIHGFYFNIFLCYVFWICWFMYLAAHCLRFFFFYLIHHNCPIHAFTSYHIFLDFFFHIYRSRKTLNIYVYTCRNRQWGSQSS